MHIAKGVQGGSTHTTCTFRPCHEAQERVCCSAAYIGDGAAISPPHSQAHNPALAKHACAATPRTTPSHRSQLKRPYLQFLPLQPNAPCFCCSPQAAPTHRSRHPQHVRQAALQQGVEQRVALAEHLALCSRVQRR